VSAANILGATRFVFKEERKQFRPLANGWGGKRKEKGKRGGFRATILKNSVMEKTEKVCKYSAVTGRQSIYRGDMINTELKGGGRGEKVTLKIDARRSKIFTSAGRHHRGSPSRSVWGEEGEVDLGLKKGGARVLSCIRSPRQTALGGSSRETSS